MIDLHNENFKLKKYEILHPLQERLFHALSLLYDEILNNQQVIVQSEEINTYRSYILQLWTKRCDCRESQCQSQAPDRGQGIAQWIREIIKTAGIEWIQRLQGLKDVVSSTSSSGIDIGISSILCLLDSEAFHEDIHSIVIIIRTELNTLLLMSPQIANTSSDTTINNNNLHKWDMSKLKLFLAIIIFWIDFLPTIEKSISFAPEDKIILRHYTPKLTATKNDIISALYTYLNDIKDRVHKALTDKDFDKIRKDLDLLHEYIVIDDFLDDHFTVAVTYEELKKFLFTEINRMNTSTNSYLMNGGQENANENKCLFERTCVFAYHFIDSSTCGHNNSSSSNSICSMSKCTTLLSNQSYIYENEINNIQKEIEKILQNDNNSHEILINNFLSPRFDKLVARAVEYEQKGITNEIIIDGFITLFKIFDEAIDLIDMISYNPKNVLFEIYNSCYCVYMRIISNIQKYLLLFKFQIASQYFDIILNFDQIDMFITHINKHFKVEDEEEDEIIVKMNFEEYTEILLKNEILLLKNNIFNHVKKILMYDDVNDNDVVNDAHEPKFDELYNLLENIVNTSIIMSAEEDLNNNNNLFNNKVNFQEIKIEVIQIIFEYSEHIDEIFIEYIRNADFDEACHFHHYMNCILHIADKFMTPTKATKIRQQCNRQAEDIKTGEILIIRSFALSATGVEHLVIYLNKLRQRHYISYKKALDYLSTRLNDEYKHFERNVSTPSSSLEVIIYVTDNTLHEIFKFISALWMLECLIDFEDDSSITKLFSRCNIQFHEFLSKVYSVCQYQCHQESHLKIIENLLSTFIFHTNQGIVCVDRCKQIIGQKIDNATTTTAAVSVSVSDLYWKGIYEKTTKRQAILQRCHDTCTLFHTEVRSKTKKIQELLAILKNFNIFDSNQNIDEMMINLNILERQIHKVQHQHQLHHQYQYQLLFDDNFNFNNEEINSHDNDELQQGFKNINKHIQESIVTVKALFQNKNYMQLLIGINNIKQLESLPILQASCVDITRVIHTQILVGHNQLIDSFNTAFQNKDTSALDKIVQEVKAWDKTFISTHNISHSFQPIMERIKSEFSRKINELIVQYEIENDMHASIISIDNYACILISIKTLVQNISSRDIQDLAHHRIGHYIEVLTMRGVDLFALGVELVKHGLLGELIISEHSQFKALVTKRFNEATAVITIDHALKELDTKNPKTMSTIYTQYSTTYEAYLREYLKGYGTYFQEPPPLQKLVDVILKKKKTCNSNFDIADLLAGVFAVWTILSSKDMFNDTKDRHCLIKPHVVQLLAIFRLLGLDTSNNELLTSLTGGRGGVGRLSNSSNKGSIHHPVLDSHLIQIGTGEGKSILIGGLSCLLAIFGYEVSCASYSAYLSNRDYKAFKELFEIFKVSGNIRYSTLSDLMESVINRNGNIRHLTKQRLLKPIAQEQNILKKSTIKNNNSIDKRILLIDEVDVLFSKDFFGATYNPIATFKSDETVTILTHIFNHRDDDTVLTLEHIKALPACSTLLDQCYNETRPIIDQQIRSMLNDVKAFNDPPYEIITVEDIGKRIGYKTLDRVNTMLNHGYKTSFAYLYEATRDEDIRAIANKQLAFQFPCGSFSFADVPINHFQCIMGVTGTLSCLSASENGIIDNRFKIKNRTVAPSIYGNSKLTFKQDGDVILEEDLARYHQTISKEIQDERSKGRPVLVFFETENELRQFERSDYGQRIDDMNVVTEKTDNVAFYVNKATSLGTVTLFPKVFGRGLDFVCRDNSVDAAGGVHVIQTFFSDYTSEEIQIKGRTARQTKKGSYKLILLLDHLTKLDLTKEDIIKASQSNTFYDQLHRLRELSISKQVQKLVEKADNCRDMHEKSNQFIDKLLNPEISLYNVLKSIQSFGSSSSSGVIQPTHLIFCLDESVSMTNRWPDLIIACKAFLAFRVQNDYTDDIVSIIQFSATARLTISRQTIRDLRDDLNLVREGSGTYFVPALTKADQIVSKDCHKMDIIMVFMTDGETSDKEQSIVYCRKFQTHFKNDNFQFFGLLHGSDSAANGSIVSAANVNELQNKFQFIAQEATVKQSRR